MSTSRTKTAPHLAAQADADALLAKERDAHRALQQARDHLSGLEERLHLGDGTVSGQELVLARGNVEAASGLHDYARRTHKAAQDQAAAALAEFTTKEMARSIKSVDRAAAFAKYKVDLVTAAETLRQTLHTGDAMSDAAGAALAAAGVPQNVEVNGIRYVGASRSGLGSAEPGVYNVEFTDSEGAKRWVSSHGSSRDTNEVLSKGIDDAASEVRHELGLSPRRRGGINF